MKPLTKEQLDYVANRKRVCADCGIPATITGYCQKHSWKKAKVDCPHCGYAKNKYYGGLLPISQCSKCKDFYKPF